MTLADAETIGFEATAPVGLWNKKLGVDYPGVFKALLKATAAFAAGNALAAVNAAIDGVAAFQIKDNQPPPVLAWHLIRIALARAMAELTVEALKSLDEDPSDPACMVARLDHALDQTPTRIDRDFFARPAELPIVEALRAPFGEWLAGFGLNEAQVSSVVRRLPAYFTFALHREWAARSARYAPIEAELRKADTPFARADARERAWLRNAAYLRRLVQEPVFDETFGLEQVYVPLRAWYREWRAARAIPHRGREIEADEEKARKIVLDLNEHLTKWLLAWDPKDPVRMICGGPGSGKTSFTKMWAASLAAQGHRVLFVPLHRLDFQGDLQRALAGFLADWNVLPDDPLDAKAGERRLLILFDGLDELAMQGRAGQEVAREFVEAVLRRIERVNEQEGRCIKVVLGGRDIVVQAAERLFEDRQILHVLPYHGSTAREFVDERKLLENEDYACGRWWRQFGEATGDSYEELPEPLAGENLAEITAQPLLNHLLALSYRQGRREFSNLNLVYQDLLGRVYERKWGPGKHPTAKVLRREDFDALLEELALAAWHSAGAARTITETEVERACERAELTTQLDAFKEGARGGAVSLLAAFYFRQADTIQGERTFEFTHKSFGEYLTARRLVRWIEDISEERARNRASRQRGWSVEEAQVKWVEATGPAAVDRDLIAFMKREVTLRAAGDRGTVDGWRETLAELFSDQLKEGLPMHKLALPTFREMTRQARNAEEALLAAHFCCAEAVQKRSAIDWPDDISLRDLITRLDQGQIDPIARRCLAWLDAKEVDGRRATHMLFRAHLTVANLGGADLQGADLQGANLAGADLTGADLTGAHLTVANLTGATLTGANLGGAELFRANLTGANLTGANLTGANLGGANLTGANLTGANLGGANLMGANLMGANLMWVRNLDTARNLDLVKSWRGARIERTWVEELGFDAGTLGLVVVDDVEGSENGQA